jgi:plastocyanin
MTSSGVAEILRKGDARGDAGRLDFRGSTARIEAGGSDNSREDPWMNRRFMVAVGATAALGVAAGVPAIADAAVPKNEIRMVGGTKLKPGKYLKIDMRFKARNTTVKSGATVKLVNKIKEPEPHTITFIEKRFLPTQGFETGLEEQLFAAHKVDPSNEEAPPGVLVVDNGQPAQGTLQVDTMFSKTVLGDSAFIAPGQKRFNFEVTADKGSKLFYYCAIHPWMQGKITVN